MNSEGVPAARGSQALKASLASQRFFPACADAPETEREPVLPGAGVRQPVCVHALEPLGDSMMRASLVAEQPLARRAGQYLTPVREDLARSHSIADIPRDDAGSGDMLRTRGPAGGRCYAALLLAGTGAGLATHGILQDFLRQGHTGETWLGRGALVTRQVLEPMRHACAIPVAGLARTVDASIPP